MVVRSAIDIGTGGASRPSEAIGGTMATEIIEGVRRIPVIVRYPESTWNGPASIGQLTLQAPSGQAVPLNTLAGIT